MSQVDHTTYIFGSFSRKRQTGDVLSPKRRSLDVSTMPATHAPMKPGLRAASESTGVSSRDVSKISDEFCCRLCNRQLVEPRVLPCLHFFCSACLQDMVQDQKNREAVRNLSLYSPPCHGSLLEGSKVLKTAAESAATSSSGSGNSGYESEVNTEESERSWVRCMPSSRAPQVIVCPTCGLESKFPLGGVEGFPLHFVLLHRMLVASLNQDSICLLCDLCSSDIPAAARCSDCLLNLCTFCCEAHKRQRITAVHDMVNLQEVQHGRAITRVHRQVMCPVHPENQLKLYCSNCGQLTCRDCCILMHRGHQCEVAARAAQTLTCKVREALEKTRQVNREAAVAKERLNVLAQRIQLRCSQVQGEVDRFVDSYIKVLEEHRKVLQKQALQARDAKLQALWGHQESLEQSTKVTGHAVRFTEELLAEGSDIEVLSLVSPLLRRLEWCVKTTETSPIPELRALETLKFLPEERAGTIKNKAVFGVVTTQTVSPAHSFLTPESVSALTNCRQQQKCEVVLVTRDCDDQPICHGAENVTVELRYRDVSQRSIPVHVCDRQNGSYLISFTPDASGNMALSVTIRGLPIKGNPSPVCVRTLRPHQGTFHCCTFCSSGGSKDVSCGCGCRMPGGYRGCGHGHAGHPGRRHWSCCGNILQNSECSRPHNGLYQFTL